MAKQLKILGLVADEALLADQAHLKSLVDAMIEAVGMRPLAEPLCVDVPLAIEKLGAEPFEDEGGISVIRMLSTSHIAIHTWPLRKEFHLDIYSCRDFQPFKIIKVLDELLMPSKVKMNDLSDACEW